MQLKNISFFLMALMMAFSTACSKKADTSDPGRSVTVIPTGGDNDEEVDRGGGDEEVIDDDDSTPENGNILSRGVVPTTKVCNNVLAGRSAETLKKFFNWDIQNLEGPVTICVEQETSTPQCSAGENYCSNYVNKYLRIRIEYEDDFKFWFYDSEKTTNYAKLISYTGGSGASTVEAILMDGAGFLRLDGIKTSAGSYDVGLSFADRPSYSAALNYDVANGYTATSTQRRAATYSDMKACAQSANGDAIFTDGSSCAGRFVMNYGFFTTLNADHAAKFPDKPILISDTSLWIENQITIARQYVQNQFPNHFTNVGVKGGTFGRLVINGL